jgi:hypothetical protein
MMHIHIKAAAVWIAAAACLPGGCASDKSKTAPDGDVAAIDSPDARPRMPSADVLRERLTGTNNGLELRRWTVIDAPDRVMNVLTAHADGAAADQDVVDRLKRNGLRFVRVPVSEVDALVAELGGATIDRNEWHGQVYDWRPLMEQPIDQRGIAVAIDGRVRRFDRGEFRVLIRAWTVQMEDGPYLHLEVLPQHRIARAGDLRRLLGEEPSDAGESFATLALDLQLEATFAYVLVSESPQIDWPTLDRPAEVNAALGQNALELGGAGVDGEPEPEITAAKTAPAAPRPPRPSRVGPPGDVGPEAGAPMTLGEMLLPLSESPPMRQVMVFVPKIPQELFPPVYESEQSMHDALLEFEATMDLWRRNALREARSS